MSRSARILIADDHELIRRGLISALAEMPHWSVVGQACNGREAAELTERLQPDIAVLDLSMPELNGLEATRLIKAHSPRTRVLIVTAHESEQLVREVLDAGAVGYVLKSDAGRVLVQAIEALLDERPFFTSKIAQRVLEGYLKATAPADESQSSGTLSPRERQIVQLLAEGKSNKEVARILEVTVKTAETHRSNIMRKMGFGSLPDLVRYAVRNRIVEP